MNQRSLARTNKCMRGSSSLLRLEEFLQLIVYNLFTFRSSTIGTAHNCNLSNCFSAASIISNNICQVIIGSMLKYAPNEQLIMPKQHY